MLSFTSTIPPYAIYAGCASLLLAILLVVTKRWHGRLTMDSSDGIQKVHLSPTPRVGGIAIMAGVLVGHAFADVEVQDLLLPLIVAGIPAFAFGLLEDITKRVGVRTRLLATMACGVLGYLITGSSLTAIGLPGIDWLLSFTLLSVLFTAFAVGGVANAVNIIDGFNGLAAGTVLIILTAFGAIATALGDQQLALVCLILAGAVAGFMLVNWPFGKLFLGDGGAYFVGFALAWVAVLLVGRNESMSPWAPLLACGYPIFEVLFSIVRRSRRQLSPGSPDRLHLHSLVKRRLVRSLMPNSSTLLRNSVTGALMWGAAILPALIAVNWIDNTPVLMLGVVLCGALYSVGYARLTQFRWCWPAPGALAFGIRKQLARAPVWSRADTAFAFDAAAVPQGREGTQLRIAVVSNTAWYLYNFRLNLMKELQSEGHIVVAVAPIDNYSNRIEKEGIVFAAVNISGGGTNALKEGGSVVDLWRTLGKHQIDLVLSYTPKGNIYSALACIARGISFVPNVSGLGRAFIHRSPITTIARLLYRLTFSRAEHVFFQNMDDLNTFVHGGLVKQRLAERLPGSGVDLSRFQVAGTASPAGTAPIFLLVARMLWDKGIGEYVEAARLVRATYPGVRFQLLGFLDVANPSAISRAQMNAWVAEGEVEYLGSTDDVRPFLQEADCVVLPSTYREGVPRTLLEAAASARPVIATDAPGCRDTVLDGETGYLCKPADASDLAAKILSFLSLQPEERLAMGIRGRAFVERRFDERLVLRRYSDVVGIVASRTGKVGRIKSSRYQLYTSPSATPLPAGGIASTIQSRMNTEDGKSPADAFSAAGTHVRELSALAEEASSSS